MEMDEYVGGFEYKGDGIYKIKCDDDCIIMEVEMVEEKDIGKLEIYCEGEFGVDRENYEYFKVEGGI